ncbi:MAG: PD-(D/E)XK nuclease family protein [Candidatus Paracaedibacteraceae bacterium]|nr:PD-(D/E)XK nuclease family protein [Candidatus Paracaedibacteraceae bacterium]
MKHAVFTIPFGESFLEKLADGIVERFGHDPLLLAKSVIILPTRRGCLGLKEAFQSRKISQALPRIIALADLEQDPILPGFVAEPLPPSMPSTQQLGLLTQLVLNYLSTHQHKPSLNSALNLSQELLSLIDEIHTSDVPLDQLQNLVSDRYAQHWQQTLDFLKIITEFWPRILTDHGMIDSARRKRDNLRLLANQWRPTYPVILAGTTATRPATRDLAKAIYNFEMGLIVLPGYDPREDDVPSTHPLYTLQSFVRYLGSPQIQPWVKMSAVTGRGKLLMQAMEPSFSPPPPLSQEERQQILSLTAMIECRDTDQEALVIALKIRQSLADGLESIVVITPDMGLTRRLQVHLKRWNIIANTSQGTPLNQTVVGRFLSLLARFVASPEPRTLLALLKHPLCYRGEFRSDHLTHVRALDLRLRRLRQPNLYSSSFLKEDQQLWYDEFLQHVNLKAMPATFKAHLIHLVQTAENLCSPEQLWSKADGQAAEDFLTKLEPYTDFYPNLSKRDFADLITKLMAQSQVHNQQGIGSPVRILGALEARQAYAPLMILGGLNEGTWPQPPSNDPWLNRQMRLDWGLPDPLRRLGLAAHDFCLGFSAPDVMITRAQKQSGSATIPSRWWLRLQTMLDSHKLDLTKDQHLLDWARTIDQPTTYTAAPEPTPTPPLDVRPTHLSTTDIEQLMRDPYGYYARRILNLRKLDRPDEELSPRDLGNLIHESLDLYHRRHPDTINYDQLIVCGHEVFSPYLQDAHVQHFWWPRFVRIAGWLIDQWQSRSMWQSVTEIEGILEIGQLATIKSIADRIDYTGSAAIILDYKTGSALPSKADISAGLSPQLTVESILLEGGAFQSIGAKETQELEYWHLTGNEAGGNIEQIKDLRTKIEEAQEGLHALLTHFITKTSPYLCGPWGEKKIKNRDYLQLSRYEEWNS